MLWSLPRPRSMVEISYGCIGRSPRLPSTAKASGFATLRFAITAPSISVIRDRVLTPGYPVSSIEPRHRAEPEPPHRPERRQQPVRRLLDVLGEQPGEEDRRGDGAGDLAGSTDAELHQVPRDEVAELL